MRIDGTCLGIGRQQEGPDHHNRTARQAIQEIPRDFELPGEDAIIRKDGQRLIIEPAPPRSLLAILATLPSLDEDFPPLEDGPAEPVDL